MNCLGCGLPMEASEMGENFKGEKVEYHGFQAKCVELLREKLYVAILHVEELRKIVSLTDQYICNGSREELDAVKAAIDSFPFDLEGSIQNRKCDHEWADVKVSSIRGLQKCQKCPEKRIRS